MLDKNRLIEAGIRQLILEDQKVTVQVGTDLRKKLAIITLHTYLKPRFINGWIAQIKESVERVVGLKYIRNKVKNSHKIEIYFKISDPDSLAVLFKMKGIQILPWVEINIVNTFPENPNPDVLYFREDK